MKVGLKHMSVVVLLLCVVVVFLSPAVDLEPTALRAVKFANLLLVGFALAATALYAWVHSAESSAMEVCEQVCALPSPPDIVELNCTRLC